MARSTHRLKGFGLALVAVLGLTALMATGAHAEWRIEGKKISSDETVTGAAHVASNFLVPHFSLSLLCSEHKIEVGAIRTSGASDGKMLLSNCKLWQNGKESPACKPIEPISAAGHAKPILHGGLTYMLFEPWTESGPYTILKFKVPCALPEQNQIRGMGVAECLNPKNLEVGEKYCEEESVTHLGQMAPQASFPEYQLTFGVHPVVFDGIAEVKLAGANEGKKASAFG